MGPEYVSGGYFLTKLFDRADYMSAELVPAQVVTLSTCLTAIFPDGWPSPGYELAAEEQRQKLAALCISPDRAAEVEEWVKLHPPDPPSIWPYVFLSVKTACEFARTFVHNAAGVLLVGLGLRVDLVDVFLQEARDHQYGETTSELAEAVRQRRSQAPGGECLGYEVLGDGIVEEHSLLCNGLEVDIDREFGIRLNGYGLIDDLEDAKRVAEWASRDDTGSEPVLWLPWRISRYPIA